jgi:hypothetical protein
LIGAYGHVNRLAVLHRADVARESIGIAQVAYNTNQQQAPLNLAISGPDLNRYSLEDGQPTPAEARHDFWASVLRGQGLFIYNYHHKVWAETVDPPTKTSATVLSTWAEYAAGLALLKHELRPFLVNGNCTSLDIQVLSDAYETIPGTDYIGNVEPELRGEWLVLPDYPALNGSLWRLGNVAYAIVTSSYAQPVSFSFAPGGVICAATELSGNGDQVHIEGGTIFDDFTGIEGRVYRIVFAHPLAASCELAHL